MKGGYRPQFFFKSDYILRATRFVCDNARKFNDQKRLLQKKSAKKFDRTIARKMSTEREQQIKTEYTENKILYFFSNNLIIISYIILFLFGLLFKYFFKYF
jgi:hypothetical protein